MAGALFQAGFVSSLDEEEVHSDLRDRDSAGGVAGPELALLEPSQEGYATRCAQLAELGSLGVRQRRGPVAEVMAVDLVVLDRGDHRRERLLPDKRDDNVEQDDHPENDRDRREKANHPAQRHLLRTTQCPHPRDAGGGAELLTSAAWTSDVAPAQGRASSTRPARAVRGRAL